MRVLLAAFFVLVAGVLSFPASAALWERRVLMDQDEFVRLGQDILKREPVQQALGERVEREVIAVAVDAGADRGGAARVSRPIVAELVKTLPESSIGVAVLSGTHELMVEVI